MGMCRCGAPRQSSASPCTPTHVCWAILLVIVVIGGSLFSMRCKYGSKVPKVSKIAQKSNRMEERLEEKRAQARERKIERREQKRAEADEKARELKIAESNAKDFQMKLLKWGGVALFAIFVVFLVCLKKMTKKRRPKVI